MEAVGVESTAGLRACQNEDRGEAARRGEHFRLDCQRKTCEQHDSTPCDGSTGACATGEPRGALARFPRVISHAPENVAVAVDPACVVERGRLETGPWNCTALGSHSDNPHGTPARSVRLCSLRVGGLRSVGAELTTASVVFELQAALTAALAGAALGTPAATAPWPYRLQRSTHFARHRRGSRKAHLASRRRGSRRSRSAPTPFASCLVRRRHHRRRHRCCCCCC